MEIKTIEVYICDHCRKLYQLKRFAIQHEPKCKSNPDNKQICLEGCIYLTKKEIKYFYDHYDGSHESEKEILYCEKYKKGVHPYWINGLLSEDIEDEIENDIMPKECDEFATGI